MPRSRKQKSPPPPPAAEPAAPASPTAAETAAPEPPAVVDKMTVPAGKGYAHLRHDRAADRWVIVLDLPGTAAEPPASVRDHLRANDFAPADDGSPAWVRPADKESRYQDLIDCERVLLKAAELLDAAPAPARRAGRGRR